MKDIQNIRTTWQKKINLAKDHSNLEDIRIRLLGRKGLVNQLFQTIAHQQPATKKKLGQELNTLKKYFEKQISAKQKLFEENTVNNTKATKPFSSDSLYQLPQYGHLHPITATELELNRLFLSLGFSIYEGPEIETDEYCFERLNVPKDHPARDLQDSLYIAEPNVLLSTQTSSVETRLLSQEKPPFKAAFPGHAFRNEKVNKINHFIFHQYQGVVVAANVTMRDLFGTIDLLFKTLYGSKVTVRYRTKYYPEVEPGVGPDMQCFSCHGAGCPICKGAGWIEMGGAGMIHPNVLTVAGINPKLWCGFAFGLGLDRWAMAKYHISDIRTLTGGNLAYKPYQP